MCGFAQHYHDEDWTSVQAPSKLDSPEIISFLNWKTIKENEIMFALLFSQSCYKGHGVGEGTG